MTYLLRWSTGLERGATLQIDTGILACGQPRPELPFDLHAGRLDAADSEERGAIKEPLTHAVPGTGTGDGRHMRRNYVSRGRSTSVGQESAPAPQEKPA